MKTIGVKVYKVEKCYFAKCSEFPVVSLGDSVDEVMFNIEESINLHIQKENLQPVTILANLEMEGVRV